MLMNYALINTEFWLNYGQILLSIFNQISITFCKCSYKIYIENATYYNLLYFAAGLLAIVQKVKASPP